MRGSIPTEFPAGTQNECAVTAATRSSLEFRRESSFSGRCRVEVGWEPELPREAVELLARPWVIHVFDSLWNGALRRSRLRESLDGISDMVLTEMLRDLERHTIIARRFYEAIPPRVEYEITSHGRPLAQPLMFLGGWMAQARGGRPAD